MQPRSKFAPILAGGLVICASLARAAEPRRVVLEYQRGIGAQGCLSQEALANDVAAYLGYNPFSPTAPERFRVEVSGDATGTLTATLALFGANGALEGRQEVSSSGPDCRQLSESLSLALSLAIDPLASRASPAPSVPTPAPVVTEVVAPTTPPAPKVPIVVAVGLGAIGTVGLAPSPELGAVLDLEARRGNYSLGIEGQANLNAGTNVVDTTGSVAVQLLGGSLVPCAHLSLFGACLLVTGGVEQGSAQGLAGATHNSTPYVAVGARAFVELPLLTHLLLRPAIEVDIPLVQTTLLDGATDAWTTSPVAAAVTLIALVPLP